MVVTADQGSVVASGGFPGHFEVATLDFQTIEGYEGDYEVLVNLSEAPDHSLRMSDLAGRLRLSPSGITRRIDGLVRSGYVERRACPTDRRGSNAVLTGEGVAALERAAPTHVRGVREHFIDRLSATQLANLATALSKLDIDDQLAAGACDEA